MGIMGETFEEEDGQECQDHTLSREKLDKGRCGRIISRPDVAAPELEGTVLAQV